MNTSRKFNFYMILFILIGLGLSQNITAKVDNNTNITPYAVSAPILIKGNDDFHTQAATKGWDLGGTRNGSKTSPYILSSISIVSTVDASPPLIKVEDTDVYFIIISSYLEGGNWGILFRNVSNVDISDNTLFDQDSGAIFLVDSKDIKVINNKIEGALVALPYKTPVGIDVYTSKRIEMTDNTIFNTRSTAIIFTISKNNTIRSNFIYDINSNAIYFDNFSKNTTIADNIFMGIKGQAIMGAKDSRIVNNYMNNIKRGIHIFNNNIVKYNVIYGNSTGIEINGDNNTVFKNNIYVKAYGIDLNKDSKNNNISNNTILSTNEEIDYDIRIVSSTNNTVNYNKLGVGIVFSSISKIEHYNQYEMIGNTVNDLPVYYLKNIQNTSLDYLPTDIGQLFIFNSSSIEIKHKNMGYSSMAFDISFSNDIVFSDNIIRNSTSGISIRYSTDIYLSNNSISFIDKKSLFVYNSTYVTITQNQLIHNGGAIELFLSNNTRIDRNYINNFSGSGIGFMLSSYFNEIYLNSISNGYTGILTGDGGNFILESNTISNMSGNGMYLSSSSTIVRSNKISNSLKRGISVGTIDGVYQYNTLIGNDKEGPQIYVFKSNNIFNQNYYDDWSGNGEYFLDVNYPISDANPLSNPHSFGAFNINYPSANINEDKIITIQWSSSVDTLSHDIKYDIEVSDDLALTWTTIATDVKQSYYEWDTRGSINNGQYKIRITASDGSGYLLDAVSPVFSVNNVAHYLTKPTINNPTGNNVSSMGHIVFWTPSIDTWDQKIHYNLYDSVNGKSWRFLGQVQNDNAFYWNTTEFEIGSTVYFKVLAISSSDYKSEDILVGTIVNIPSSTVTIIEEGPSTVVIGTQTITISDELPNIVNSETTPGFSVSMVILSVIFITSIRDRIFTIFRKKK